MNRDPADKAPSPAPDPAEEARLRDALLFMLEDLEASRNRLEQAYREWQASFDGVLDPIFLHDRDFRIVRANRAYAKRAGMPVAEVIGKPYFEVFPKVAGPMASCLRVVAPGAPGAEERGAEEAEDEIETEDGSSFLSRSFPVRDEDGKYLYSVHILTDITARKRAETERSLLAEALRRSAAGILLTDPDFRITYVNPAFVRLFGYEAAEIVGQPSALLLPSEPGVLTPQDIAEQVRAHGYWNGEVLRRAKDGTSIPVFLAVGAVDDERGRVSNYVASYLDLREIRRAEAALREREAFHRAILEDVADLICRWRPDGTITYVNDLYCRYFNKTPQELIGHSFMPLIPEEDRAKMAAHATAITKDNPIAVIQHRVVDGQGRLRWQEWLDRGLFDAAGNPVEFQSTGRDITERKRAEEALLAQGKLLEAFFENTLTLIAILDRDFNFVRVNEAYARADERDVSEFPGRNHFEMYPSDAKAIFERVVATKQPFRITARPFAYPNHPERGVMYWDWTLEPLLDDHGEVDKLVFTLANVTERVRAELALRESEEKFRVMASAALNGVILMDNEGRVRFWNRAAEKIFGWTSEEAIGRPAHGFLAPERYQEAARHGVEEFLKTGKGPVVGKTLELAALRKDGTEFPVELSVAAFSLGGTWHAIGIVRDITERKRAEETIRRVNRALYTLSAGNEALVRATDETTLLQESCRIAVEVGGYHQAFIGFAEDDAKKTISVVAQRGAEMDYLKSLELTWADTDKGQTTMGRAIRSGAPQVTLDAMLDPRLAVWHPAIEKLGFKASASLPLKGSDGKTFGVLTIAAAEAKSFDEDEIKLLTELADDIAFGIVTLRTRVERDRIAHEHQHHAEILRKSLEDSIKAISSTVEARDPYTAGHQRRVAELATAIARDLGLSENRVHGLYLAAIVHDLGKIGIPAEILNKPGRLNEVEFALIKTHSQTGHNILKDIAFPWPVARMVIEHHERLDGSGYPNGSKGDEILIESKILAVADVVESMMSHRPYRPALGIDAALAEVTKGRGTFFDPAAVDACVRLFREKGFAFG